MKRKTAAWSLGGVLLSSLIAASPEAVAQAPTSELLRFERSFDAMGTTYIVAAYGLDRFRMEAAIDEAFEEVRRVDQLLSNYRKDSEWSQINQRAATAPVPLSEESFALIARCLDYSRSSEGAFDITVGPLMKLWGFFRGQGRIPHRAEIRSVLGRIGYQHIQLDAKQKTIRFLRPGMEIDPGGIGKGYVVDRMADILRRKGVSSALISAGRSSIYAIGAPPQEPRGWTVAIPHPRDSRKQLTEYFLRNESMSTSGTSEKFFVVGGTTYSHIMDPRTGMPARGVLSVSVIAPKTLDSEAWTKPFFVQGRQWTARHKPKEFRVFLCEDRTENPCVSLP